MALYKFRIIIIIIILPARNLLSNLSNYAWLAN